mgnify:CR=1 FL=1
MARDIFRAAKQKTDEERRQMGRFLFHGGNGDESRKMQIRNLEI